MQRDMPQPRTSAVVPVLLFGALCAAALIFSLRLGGRPVTWPFVAVLVYFTLLSLLIHLWQEQVVGGDARRFIRRFMAGLVIKLLLSLGVVVALAMFSGAEKAPLITAFVLLYLAFLAFGTARLVMLLKRGAA